MVGAHSLKAWGLRLKNQKDDYDGGWETFNEDMLHYCVQDVAVNVDLVEKLGERIPLEAALLDCEVARICERLRRYGVTFDVDRAEKLVTELMEERDQLTKQLRKAFPAWVQRTKQFTPKRSQNRKHTRFVDGKIVECDRMEAGETFWKGEEVEFNPASAAHIIDRLQTVRGWKPKVFTDGGAPSTKAEVLKDLTYPEAPALARYQEIKKILGYLHEGKNAWLKLETDGRVHGSINPTGTVSSRASHANPNLGNVPSRSDLGHRCRELFVASPGKVIVGADASGLQLRGLGNYLARWDKRAFAEQTEDGDIHEFMRQGTGLYVRSNQKTWTYAKLFGAGDALLGQTVIKDWYDAFEQGLTEESPPKQSAARRLGKTSVERLGQNIVGFESLMELLAEKAKRGHLLALDGRKIPISSEHIAIAMLLQSHEATIMKRAMVIAAPKVYALGGEFILWVHDEFQVECDPDVAEEIGQVLVDAMRAAGEFYEQNVRIDGEYQIGTSWAETH